ncbi:MAG: glycosyltransferase family 87 protein [Phycisphaerales bacterium]|jgi:hypothetical protein
MAPPSKVLRWLNEPALWWLLACIPVLIGIISSLTRILHAKTPANLEDFRAAARAMLDGQDIYASGHGGYLYPPLIAFLYQPLAMMGDQAAALTSLAINASLMALTLWLVSRVMVRRIAGLADPLLIARVAALGAWLTFDKMRAELAMLETNVFMLLAFTMAMRYVDRRPWIAGLALGFAFNIKYLPIVLVPYLLLRRRFATVAWFALFAVAWGLLPAVSLGWRGNLAAWKQASAGLLGLFGVKVAGAGAAQIKPITNPTSVSLTSGLARIFELTGTTPIKVAAIIAIVFAALAAWHYRRNRLPLLAWPSLTAQALAPFRGLLTIEWMGMLLFTLIFSPFTNSRHMYMLLDVNIAAGVMLLTARKGVPRWPLGVAALLLWAGITLPPGGKTFQSANEAWRGIGGAGWCMLLMYTSILWTSVRYQRATEAQPAAQPTPATPLPKAA